MMENPRNQARASEVIMLRLVPRKFARLAAGHF
jgi:hypothetical protein